jgi:hypothetical protein
MSPQSTISREDQKLTLSRLNRHAKKHYVRKRGVKEIRAHFKGNLLFLEVVKEAKEGLVGRVFRMGTVRGVARLARLEYLGPNKWRFLIYDYDMNKYTTHQNLREGTIEECLDAAGKVYLSG